MCEGACTCLHTQVLLLALPGATQLPVAPWQGSQQLAGGEGVSALQLAAGWQQEPCLHHHSGQVCTTTGVVQTWPDPLGTQ